MDNSATLLDDQARTALREAYAAIMTWPKRRRPDSAPAPRDREEQRLAWQAKGGTADAEK